MSHLPTLTRFVLSCAVPVVGGLAACGRDDGADGPRGRLAIDTSPLALAGITDAEYSLAVYNGAGQRVWSADHLRSSRYGDGRGALAYVGTCDASPGVTNNRVELTVTALFDGARTLGPDEWQDPTADGPLVKMVDCVADADVAVRFDLTILRPASQGFFDVGVTFADVFCSAKVDCQDALLHDDGVRAPTVVMTLACTSGEGAPTWLHYSDVALQCGDKTTWLDPTVGPGQTGARPPTLFQVATYRDVEDLPTLDKCYWNLALGMNLGTESKDCKLLAYASASDQAWAGESPEGTVYPYIAFEVPLTDGTGAFTCGSHPLDGAPAGVRSGYTRGSGFPHQWRCGDAAPTDEGGVTCSGLAVGADGPATFTQTPGGVTFTVDGKSSSLLGLAGHLRVRDCCANPCPDCAPGGDASGR